MKRNEPAEDPGGWYSKFLTRMDVERNALEFNIWESEDPEITYLWKKYADDNGFVSARWSYNWVMGFLDTLGRKNGALPDTYYDENSINPGDEKLGIDVSLKAARIYSRNISRSAWISAGSALVAEQTKEQFAYLLKIMAVNRPEAKKIRTSFLTIPFIDLVKTVRSEGGDIGCVYNAFLRFFGENLPEAERYFARIGKFPYRAFFDNWNLFIEPTPDSIPPLSEVPTSPEIVFNILAGNGIHFFCDAGEFLVFYPFDTDPETGRLDVHFYIKEGNAFVEKFQSCNIDSAITGARFRSEGSNQCQTLLKVVRNARKKEVLTPGEVKDLLSAH